MKQMFVVSLSISDKSLGWMIMKYGVRWRCGRP